MKRLRRIFASCSVREERLTATRRSKPVRPCRPAGASMSYQSLELRLEISRYGLISPPQGHRFQASLAARAAPNCSSIVRLVARSV